MNTPEQLLIRDHLFRKRFYYIAGFVLHLVLMTVCWWVRPVNLIGILGGSALMLGFDLSRNGAGLARTLLSMPVTAGQLARCWRLVSFTLPALAGLLILGVSAVIAVGFHAPLWNPGGFAIIAFTQTMLLGTLLFMLTGLPGQTGPGDSPGRRIANACFGLAWGFSYWSVIFLAQDIPRKWAEVSPAHIAVGLLLAIATAAGFLRVDQLVIRRMDRGGAGIARRVKTRMQPAVCGGFGAMPYLLVRSGIFILAMVAMMLAFNWVSLTLLRDSPRSTPSMVSITVFIPFISLFSAQYLTSQLRVLRTLPLGRGTLTHLLVLWPLVLVAISLAAGGLINRVFFGTPFGTGANWIIPLATAILTGLMLPLMLRFGMRYWMIFVVIFPAMFLSSLLGGPLFKSQDPLFLSKVLIAALAVLAVLAAEWVACFRLLASPYPWRAGALKWPGQNRQLG